MKYLVICDFSVRSSKWGPDARWKSRLIKLTEVTLIYPLICVCMCVSLYLYTDTFAVVCSSLFLCPGPGTLHTQPGSQLLPWPCSLATLTSWRPHKLSQNWSASMCTRTHTRAADKWAHFLHFQVSKKQQWTHIYRADNAEKLHVEQPWSCHSLM